MTAAVQNALHALYQQERERLLQQSSPAGWYDLPVFGKGQAVDPFLVLIGEAPGKEEATSGRPFVGKAGKQLDELLALAEIPRGRVYITNTVKYRPVIVSGKSVRNRTPGKPEIQESLPLLRAELALLSPACIVTLGNVPLNAVLALYGEKPRTIGELHGKAYPLEGEQGAVTLFPLYHPASTIYNRALLPQCKEDIRALGTLYRKNGI